MILETPVMALPLFNKSTGGSNETQTYNSSTAPFFHKYPCKRQRAVFTGDLYRFYSGGRTA